MNPADLKSSSERIQDAVVGGGFPSAVEEQIRQRLSVSPFAGAMVAVRSSGVDEDSAAHSFAGTVCILCGSLG